MKINPRAREICVKFFLSQKKKIDGKDLKEKTFHLFLSFSASRVEKGSTAKAADKSQKISNKFINVQCEFIKPFGFQM